MTTTCRACDHRFPVEIDYQSAEAPRLYGRPEDCYPGCDAQVTLIEPFSCPECNTPVDEDRLRVDFLERLPARGDED